MNSESEKKAYPAGGKEELFLSQKSTLDVFLERHAITRAQYEKSLGDLTEKMGMAHLLYGAVGERRDGE